MKLKHSSAVVELAIRATEQLAAGQSEGLARLELMDWAEDHLEKEDALSAVRRLALSTSLPAYAYLVRTIRLAASTLESVTDGKHEILSAIALPMFLTEREKGKPAHVPNWEVREQLERRLEEVMELPPMSVRLCAFPVEPMVFASLTPAQQRQLLPDFFAFGDSNLLAMPSLEQDDPVPGLLWLGMVRFARDTYEEDVRHFRKRMVEPVMQTFMRDASLMTTKALAEFGTGLSASFYPPSPAADCMTNYRLLKLSRAIRTMATPELRGLLYRFQSGRLTLWLLGPDDHFLSVFEQDHVEDPPSLVTSALARIQAKHDVPVTEVDYMPPLPREAAYPSR